MSSSACPSKKSTSLTPNIIAVASGKGGVGKSTVCHNLACFLADSGYRIGIIDADIYGSSQSGLFGAEQEECLVSEDGWILPINKNGVHFVSISALMQDDAPVIWRAPMATRLIGDFLTRVRWPDLDFLLIDLPPGTGDIQITLAQQAQLAGAIIVTTPQKVAYAIAEKAIKMFDRVHIPTLGIVENMSGHVCSHCGETSTIFSQGGGELLAEKHNCPILAQIPLESELVALAEQGQSMLKSQGVARLAYQQLSKNFLQALEQHKNKHPHAKAQVVNKQLQLDWSNGKTHYFNAYELRLTCPCATCIDETTGQPLLDKSTISLDIGIEAVETVGRYGLKVTFSDKHNTGIFTFDALNAMQEAMEQQSAAAFEV